MSARAAWWNPRHFLVPISAVAAGAVDFLRTLQMLGRVAWRNIWRNPRRSWVLISAVAVGVFSFLGTLAYVDGFSMQLIDAAIRLQGGHIQIAGQSYFESPVIHTTVRDVQPVETAVQVLPEVEYLIRLAAPGIMNSADQAAGVMILGVDPARERAFGQVPSLITEGAYLSDTDEGIVVGAALAEQLRSQVGERIVLMANSLDGELSAAAFRITGLFESTSEDFDKTHVFLHRAEVQTLIGFADREATSIALFLERGVDASPLATQLRAALAGQDLEVLTWRDRSPLMVMMDETMNLANIILVVILFTAIGFTLINSFLMVIYERLREIGIMMANGVRPSQVRWILYLEAILMVAVGIFAGTLLATGLIAWWHANGLDLSAFSEGLRAFGSGSVIYPRVDLRHVATGYATILVMVSLAVAWPAWKASRFQITAALHHA